MERPNATTLIDGDSPTMGMNVGVASAALETSVPKKEREEVGHPPSFARGKAAA